jgi:hypothetical protein
MLRSFCAIILCALMGCYVYIEPSPSRSPSRSDHDGYYQADEIWIASAYVDCVDVGPRSEWYMEARVVVSVYSGYNYHYEEDIDVTIYIDGWDWYWTAHDGGSYWTRTFLSSYYTCDEAHDFMFVAQDIDGAEDSTVVRW